MDESLNVTDICLSAREYAIRDKSRIHVLSNNLVQIDLSINYFQYLACWAAVYL